MVEIYSRKEVIERLHETRKKGLPIISASVGIGLLAKCYDVGGADLIALYDTGRYRMMGFGTGRAHIIGDINGILIQMAKEMLPVVKATPVLAGVSINDPTRDIPKFLRELKEMGFSGVHNANSSAMMPEQNRRIVESMGMGFEYEIKMMKVAQELDLFTDAYAFTEEQARKWAEADVDSVCAHMRWTAGGLTGNKPENAISLGEAAKKVQSFLEAARAAKPEIIGLCHGGPIATPADAAYIYENAPACDGFVGGSATERLPVENAILSIIKEFKKPIKRKSSDNAR